MKKAGLFLLVIMMASVSGVLASGLSIPEQGAMAMGMSAAMTARSEDLSSIYYNPAGLDYVEGREITLGITPIMPSHKYHPFYEDRKLFDSQDAASNTFFPPQIYAAWRTSEKMVLGIGVFAPFGLGTEWNDKWDGRYTSTFAEITLININPTVSYRVHEKVSIGFGVSYMISSATIEKMVDTGSALFESLGSNPALVSMMANTDYDTKFGLKGDGSGYGYNFGILFDATERLKLGASFRSKTDIEYDGTAKFTHKQAKVKETVYGATAMALAGSGLTDAQIAAQAAGNADLVYASLSDKMPASQDGTATLNMPWMLNLGLKYDLSSRWDTSVDVDITGWKVYDELVIDFGDNKPADEKVMSKAWRNSYVFRLGSSYDVTDAFVARAGMLYDRNPVPESTMDAQLPDSNRLGISVGAGYKLGSMRFDVSYMLLRFYDRNKENGVGFEKDLTGDGTINRFDVPTGYPIGNGTYKSRANLISASATFNF